MDRYGVSQIGIFGSVARNEATSASDLNIVVHMQPNLLKRACLKAELEEHFGRPIDVIRYWHGINQYLKRRIDLEAAYAEEVFQICSQEIEPLKQAIQSIRNDIF